MPRTDFATLDKSELNAFLFADIGIEANGSKLTMLSMLARLGRDPWAQAASWSAASRPVAIDGLAASIEKMPLDREALAAARATAARLILLLPRDMLTAERLKVTLRRGRSPRERARLFFIGVGILTLLVLALASARRLEAALAPHGGAAHVAETRHEVARH